MVAVELTRPGTLRAGRRRHRGGRQGLPRRRPGRAHLRHLRQRAAAPAAAGDARATCSTRGSASSRRPSRVGWPDRVASADTVLVGGRVFVDGASRPGAVAVAGGRIVARRHRRRGPRDRRVRAPRSSTSRGGLVLPGFQDAHAHPLAAGVDMLRCDLNAATSAEDTLDRIAAYADGDPDLPWVLGSGWSMATSPAAARPASAGRGGPRPAGAAEQPRRARHVGQQPGARARRPRRVDPGPARRPDRAGRGRRTAGHAARGCRRHWSSGSRRCRPRPSSWPACSPRRR